MILASAESSNSISTLQDPNHVPRTYAHSLNSLSSLDEIRFHVIDLLSGKVTDRIKFSQDYILLSNHAGVSMNGRNLAIVSLQHQLVRVYTITLDGKFILKGIIGHVLFPDEELAPLFTPQ